MVTEFPLLWEKEGILRSLFAFELAVGFEAAVFISTLGGTILSYVSSSATGFPHRSAKVGGGGYSALHDGALSPSLGLCPTHSSIEPTCVSLMEFRAQSELWGHPAFPLRTSCKIVSCGTYFVASFSFQ